MQSVEVETDVQLVNTELVDTEFYLLPEAPEAILKGGTTPALSAGKFFLTCPPSLFGVPLTLRTLFVFVMGTAIHGTSLSSLLSR